MKKALGQGKPEELIVWDKIWSVLIPKAQSYFKFWQYCQNWDGAGNIRLETIRELAGDFGYEYDPALRQVIFEIEQMYRGADPKKKDRLWPTILRNLGLSST